jgi:RecA-family ATPase
MRLAADWKSVDDLGEQGEDGVVLREPQSAWEAVARPKPMREVIIDGLVRRGEVLNCIAGTKVGKSWLALLLAFCVATGRPFLGRGVTRGRVLLLDNELHPETIQNRLAAVAQALGISPSDAHEPFEYLDLRGQAVGIDDLSVMLQRYQSGELTLVILDAKYRFLDGLEENSNSDQTLFHNAVDRLADQLGCVICMIHHATKGSQSGKSVTDVGSGGGAQSRTVDCHLVIRAHDEADDLAVMDAAVRTFAPVAPETLRWCFPLWRQAVGVDPVLKQDKTRGDARQEAKDREALSKLSDVFAEHPGESLTRYQLKQELGFGADRVNRLLRMGLDEGRFKRAGSRKARNAAETELFCLAGDYHHELNKCERTDSTNLFDELTD